MNVWKLEAYVLWTTRHIEAVKDDGRWTEKLYTSTHVTDKSVCTHAETKIGA